jgi:glycosyltransferase involved in cell wall biosynthesis
VRIGLSRAARVVALWEGAAATLRSHFGVDAAKIRVIPNGVVASRFTPGDDSTRAAARRVLGLDADAFVAVYVGALVPEKGVDLAIEAVGRATGVRLAIVGSGPDDARLRALAARVGGGRVLFTGTVPDPLTAYRAGDVLVLPSRGGDSMPAVVVEAALSGLPAITTAVGALPEMVAAGETGDVLPVGDVDALTAALDALVASPDTARALGRAARARALARYTMEPVSAAWARLLAEVAG